MSVKAYIGLLSKLEHISADLLRDLSKLTLEYSSSSFSFLYCFFSFLFFFLLFVYCLLILGRKNDRDVLMTDLRVGEVLMQSQMHMFGFEYQTCLQFTKVRFSSLSFFIIILFVILFAHVICIFRYCCCGLEEKERKQLMNRLDLYKILSSMAKMHCMYFS